MKKPTMLLLWIGAAISISEIFTGGLLAPLGLGKGLAAILIGHLIGVALLAFGGYVSFARDENAMGAVARSFGRTGGKLVALCNVVQLIGWTVVMIVQAGGAITSVFPRLPFAPAAFALSALVLAWALLLGSPAVRLNNVVVILLSILCAVLFAESVGAGGVVLDAARSSDTISMALAIELSIAMPVSWLPLVGDYSVSAGDRACAAGMPFAGYFAGSVLMYLFGLFIAISAGGDFFTFIAASRFRYLACGVVLFSTLTTAFLDLYSAAESSRRIVGAKSKRAPILAAGLFATVLSVIFPVELYGDFLTGFLTSIGMVFVPVYAVVFLDFIMNRPTGKKALHPDKLLTALVGMVAYNLFSRYEVGIPTLMSILTVAVVYTAYSVATRRKAAI